MRKGLWFVGVARSFPKVRWHAGVYAELLGRFDWQSHYHGGTALFPHIQFDADAFQLQIDRACFEQIFIEPPGRFACPRSTGEMRVCPWFHAMPRQKVRSV